MTGRILLIATNVAANLDLVVSYDPAHHYRASMNGTLEDWASESRLASANTEDVPHGGDPCSSAELLFS